MANSWDEFFAAPVKASKKLHVTASDVKRGAQIDSRRRAAERLVAEQNKTTPTGLPYGITPRPSGVPSDAPSLYAGELAKSAPPELISNALLAGNLGGLSAAFGALAPLRAGLAVGAGADAVLGAKAGEGDIPAVLSGAGMMGRRALPVALATGAAYAADAEAMPFVKWISRLSGTAGKVEPLALYVNPTKSELGDMWKTGRQYRPDSAIRLMRDRKTPSDVYAWDGSDTLHQEVADSLGRPLSDFTGRTLNYDRSDYLDRDLEFLRSLNQDPQKFAGGGLVKSGLKMMFPNLAAPMHVVKPKGGNWLNNSVEDALSGLKTEMRPPVPGAVRGPIEPYNNGVSERVRWLSPEGHTIEVQEGPAGHFGRQDSMDSWIEGPLTKYVKTRMASPEDEVRRLAEEGIGYVDFSDVGMEMMGRKARHKAGMPLGNAGESAMARGWEDVADVAATPTTAYKRMYTQGGLGNIIKDPWLEKVSPNTPVYGSRISGGVNDLGFDHLTDELSNALDPNSGLPRHLQLTPEAVKNLSMEKAVRRVADINAWRAAQKIEASQKIAGGPGQELVREYAHSPEKPNPKGLRWVELKKQPGEALNDEQLAKAMEERGMYPDEIEAALKDPKQRAQIEEQAFADTGALADQLKYEGDTMGHCVGGYCDDVASGNSRIFSLRDAKGEPHVTVEVEPDRVKENKLMSAWTQADVPEVEQERRMALANKFYASLDNEPTAAQKIEFIRSQDPTFAATLENPPPKITQIKGKQNRKPKDEYLPFVQDFVKNPPHGAPWGDVGDLENSGLFRVQPGQKWPGFSEDMPAGYWSVEDAEKQAVEKGMDPDVLQNWLQKLRNPHPGYASGGSVSDVARGWDVLTDPLGSPEENKLSWDIFSGHNSPEQLEALA